MYWWCEFADGRSARVMQWARARPCIARAAGAPGARQPPRAVPAGGGLCKRPFYPGRSFPWKGVCKRLWVWARVSLWGCGLGPFTLMKWFETSSELTAFKWVACSYFGTDFLWSFLLVFLVCLSSGARPGGSFRRFLRLVPPCLSFPGRVGRVLRCSFSSCLAWAAFWRLAVRRRTDHFKGQIRFWRAGEQNLNLHHFRDVSFHKARKKGVC